MIEKIKEICNCKDNTAEKILEVLLKCFGEDLFETIYLFQSPLVSFDNNKLISINRKDIMTFLSKGTTEEITDEYFSDKTLSFFNSNKTKSCKKDTMIESLIKEVYISIEYFLCILSTNIYKLYQSGSDIFSSREYTSNLKTFRKKRGDGYDFLKHTLVKFISDDFNQYSQHQINELLNIHFINFRKEFLKKHPQSTTSKDLAGNTINLFIIDRLTTEEISKELNIGDSNLVKNLLIEELKSFVILAFRMHYEKELKMKITPENYEECNNRIYMKLLEKGIDAEISEISDKMVLYLKEISLFDNDSFNNELLRYLKIGYNCNGFVYFNLLSEMNILEETLSSLLNERDLLILKLRFGLLENNKKSLMLKEIADILPQYGYKKVAIEAIRQNINKSIRKINFQNGVDEFYKMINKFNLIGK